MHLNLSSAAFLLASAAPASAQEYSKTINLRDLTCVYQAMEEMAELSKTESEIHVENDKGTFTVLVDSKDGMFRNVVTGEYVLKNTFAMTVSPDGIYALRAAAHYDDTDMLIKGDGNDVFFAGEGDTYIMQQNYEGFKKMENIASRCIF